MGSRPLSSTVVSLTSLLCLAACAGGDAKQAPAADSTKAASAATTAAPTVVTITAKDYGYEAPDTIAAGMVALKLVNQGPSLHHVQLWRLTDGKSYADLVAGLKQMKPTDAPPSWMVEVAGPNTPVPGGEASITENLEPGTYAIMCMIPAADHAPHFVKGMMRPLTVVAPAVASTAAAPASDVSVKMTDYAWEVTPALSKGKHMLKLENGATQPHEMLLVQLAPGKSAMDVVKWVDKQEGPPPAKPMGGISGMRNGATVYVPVDLEPGQYAFICFLPDAKDGKPHALHGMVKEFSVM